MIKLFVGLGNPGPQYETTRHNAGFWWLDQVADHLHVSLAEKRSFAGRVAQAGVGTNRIWLLQPQTFMNESGRSVAALANFYKIQPQEILVAHDELDLPPGAARLKHGGGHAGHNGLRSIHAHLGSPDYWRLRLGIGHPGGGRDVISWVLGRPQADELRKIKDALERALSVFDLLASGQVDKATQRLHTSAKPAAKPRAAPGSQAHDVPSSHQHQT